MDGLQPQRQRTADPAANASHKCGLCDEIFLDHWNEALRLEPYRTYEADLEAKMDENTTSRSLTSHSLLGL